MRIKKKTARVIVVVIVGLVGTAFAARQVSAAPATGRVPALSRSHNSTVRFWTNARVAKANARAFTRSARSGRFAQMTRRATDWYNLGSQWTDGGDVTKNVGRVFFEMGGQYWTCSSSAVTDTKTDRSVVLTAAHCAYDESGRYGFARRWMFVPAYSTLPARFDPDGLFCTATSLGCWTAQALVVSNEYASAGSFNETAVLHDYAFAVVGAGGKSGVQLDSVVTPNQASWTERSAMDDTYLFGYPAAGRYKGSTLLYCHGPLEYDSRMDWQTYRVRCSMTGGSSGGPWFSPFDSSGTGAGSGVVMSVNSYGYGGTKAMYGPILGAETAAMFGVAQTATANTLVNP